MGIASSTLALVSAASTAVGTVATISAQAQQAEAQEAQADFQRQVSLRNQEIARNRAKEIREAGEIEEARQRRQTRRTIGAQRATLAAQGVQVDAPGTAIGIIEGTAEIGELDALTIRANAERRARATETQAQAAGAQAGLFSLKRDNAGSGLAASQFGTLATGITQAGSTLNNAGFFNGSGDS